jgi:hypothetical protein
MTAVAVMEISRASMAGRQPFKTARKPEVALSTRVEPDGLGGARLVMVATGEVLGVYASAELAARTRDFLR